MEKTLLKLNELLKNVELGTTETTVRRKMDGERGTYKYILC